MKLSFNGIGMTSQRTRDRLAKKLQEDGIEDTGVLETIKEVPRHIFVDEALASRAYENTALPIGHGQTISQPYVVALMTQALVLGRPKIARVLEIGTGCGYQTAVLSRLVERVFSVERIPALHRKAQERIHALGLHNIRMKLGDGNLGWKLNAPYDGILVTAAPLGVPVALLNQLAPKGRLVIPVGGEDVQRLLLITEESGTFAEELLDYVSFVPMLTGEG